MPASASPAPRPFRIAVLASGRGSNLQALIDAIDDGRLGARIVGVFSDRAACGAIERARAAGLTAEAVDPKGFAGRLAFDEHLFSRIEAVHPDLIVCAGYMRLISQPAVEFCLGRMVNIHPSLLPAFKGLRTHEQALAAGTPVHGASVHYVTPELDGGPVLAQAPVPVLPGDDAATLGARVLMREHPLLLATVAMLADGRLGYADGQPRLDGAPLERPLRLGADDALHAAD